MDGNFKKIEQLKQKIERYEKIIKALSRTGKIPRKIPISRKELSKFIKQNKTTKEIASHYEVSERTIYRRISEYGLKGIRPRGRKSIRIKEIVKQDKWITVQNYIDKLNRKYHFVNVNYPRTRFINEKTLVCSDEKSNPTGNFTSVGIYYVVRNSNVYFVYRTSIRCPNAPAPFDEVYQWAKRNAYDIVSNLWIDQSVEVEEVIALTFINPAFKPEKVSNEVT